MEMGKRDPKRMYTTRISGSAIDQITELSEGYNQPKAVVLEELVIRFAPVLMAELEEKKLEQKRELK